MVASRTVHLFEWQSLPPDPGSPTHGWFPPPDPRAKSLVQALARDGALEIQELRGGAVLRASSFVGCISIGELRIVIEPKIRGMRLLQLLRYAYGLRDLRLLTSADSAVEETSFQDLLIHQLLVEAREILSRGIHLRYVRPRHASGALGAALTFRRLLATTSPLPVCRATITRSWRIACSTRYFFSGYGLPFGSHKTAT